MQIVIDIDEKEFGIDIANHFQDFFKRLQAEIKTRLISDDTLVCGAYELETVEMFLNAFANAYYLKRHGRLIDVNELCEGRVSNDPVVIATRCATTVIEADKA